jgi:hypothetical protein
MAAKALSKFPSQGAVDFPKQISIELEVTTRVKTRHYTSETSGDLKVPHQHEESIPLEASSKVH